MDKYDDLLFKLLSEKHPEDRVKANLVYKRVLLRERRKKLLATLFLIALSYPLLYYYIFGLSFGLFINLYSFVSGIAIMVNHELISYFLTLIPIFFFLITLLIFIFSRIMKLNQISLRII